MKPYTEGRYTFSHYRFDELIAFLRQYPEKRKKINDAMFNYKSQNYNNVHVQTSGIRNDVLNTIIAIEEDPKLQKAQKDIDLIEETAKQVECGKWYDALIATFCYGKSYNHIISTLLIPTYNRQAFYDVKKEFLEQINRKDWYRAS